MYKFSLFTLFKKYVNTNEINAVTKYATVFFIMSFMLNVSKRNVDIAKNVANSVKCINHSAIR